MGTTFGIPMNDTTKKHEGYENYMKRMMAEAEQQPDEVNHPSHYTHSGDIECIDAIKAALGDNFIYFLQGNTIKYLWRFSHKGKPKQDLQKARWYIDRAITEVGE